MPESQREHQNIILTLTDGQVIVATAPVFCRTSGAVSLASIEVTEPKTLLENLS